MISLNFVLMLAGILFALSVAGIFLNRKNVILLLMCIELMLLAVNFNFVAFARQLGDLSGQVFVFFILTVAAADPLLRACGTRNIDQIFSERAEFFALNMFEDFGPLLLAGHRLLNSNLSNFLSERGALFICPPPGRNKCPANFPTPA